MKRIALIPLITLLFVTQFANAAYMRQSTSCIITRLNSYSNNVSIALEYTNYKGTETTLYIGSVNLSSLPSINGSYAVSTDYSNYVCFRDSYGDESKMYGPTGTLTFTKSGSGYIIKFVGTAYDYYEGNVRSTWNVNETTSAIPVTALNSNGTTIELTDEGGGSGDNEGGGDSDSEGYWANFKFGVHQIETKYYQYYYWNNNDDMFVEVEAYNSTLTSKNYCILRFWVTSSYKTTMGGVTAPVAGTYTRINPTNYQNGYWWNSNYSSCPNNVIIGEATNNSGYSNDNGSYYGSYNNGLTEYAYPSQAIVAVGKEGKPYIRVYDNNGDLAVTIGEPAVTRVDVTLNSNGGSNNGQVVSATKGSAMPTTLKAGGAIAAPAKTGYTFDGYVANSDGTGKKYYNANLTSANNWDKTVATTIYAKWSPNTNTAYTVNHYQQNMDCSTYPATPFETENLTGTTDASVTPSVKAYTGFTAPSTQTVTILADGSLVVNYYYTRNSYTLTWTTDGDALIGTYTSGTVAYGTKIAQPNTPTKSGDTFNGWDANNDGTADNVAATMPNKDVTYKALWTAASPNITLCEKCDNSHYNTFKATYSGSAGVGVNVTYPRQFTASRWSTMCLPFNLDLAAMITNKMYGCVYEFKYATGNANVGSGVNLYFTNAKSIEAGKCYIVNANSALAEKTSFVFSGVTIDLSKDNGAALDSEDDYDDLPGYKSQGTIELVGTLRNGTLQGSATGNKYMGLKENKIYYPNTDTGSTIWAYRGIFRSTSALNVEKMRIVVDGEDKGEIRIDNGELIIDNGSPVRKFIRNGNLYIEREGVIYDAQGKRVE